MSTKRAVTYSLLAHIQSANSVIENPISPFIPLIKKVLILMFQDGQTKGKHISEIQQRTRKEFDIEFPIPVIKSILRELEKECNTDDYNQVKLYNDGSFDINKQLLFEFDDIIKEKKKSIADIESVFEKFCLAKGVKKKNYSSLFDFIQKRQVELLKYLNDGATLTEKNTTVEAQFIKYFQAFDVLYDEVKRVYVGSLITTYLDYKPIGIKTNVELLFDTNFIISLLDLNTKESTHSCKKLIEVASKYGYSFSVLESTIEEAKNLLHTRAEYFNKSFLVHKVNPEDIYNACDRKNLYAVDLQRISDNIEKDIEYYDIKIIPNKELDYYKKIAKLSSVYKELLKIRKQQIGGHSDLSALHDATAIIYVEQKRQKKDFQRFEDVNCWFVNNNSSRKPLSYSSIKNKNKRKIQPLSIPADSLLNILWLSNPGTNLDLSEIASISLSTLISTSINQSLPTRGILNELENNMNKYHADKRLSDNDIFKAGMRIAVSGEEKTKEINNLAETDSEEFVKVLNQEASKAKEEEKKIQDIFDIISRGLEEAKSIGDGKISSLQQKLLQEKNESRDKKCHIYIRNKVKKWQLFAWMLFTIFILIILCCIVVFFITKCNGDFFVCQQMYKNNSFIFGAIGVIITLIGGVFVYMLKIRCLNHSNIASYRKKIPIPENLRKLTITDIEKETSS